MTLGTEQEMYLRLRPEFDVRLRTEALYNHWTVRGGARRRVLRSATRASNTAVYEKMSGGSYHGPHVEARAPAEDAATAHRSAEGESMCAQRGGAD